MIELSGATSMAQPNESIVSSENYQIYIFHMYSFFTCPNFTSLKIRYENLIRKLQYLETP